MLFIIAIISTIHCTVNAVWISKFVMILVKTFQLFGSRVERIAHTQNTQITDADIKSLQSNIHYK